MLFFDSHTNVVCVISFHTYGWIEPCLQSFREYHPLEPLLIVDNNPSQLDNPSRKQSFQQSPVTMWKSPCEAERQYLHSLAPPTTVIQTPVWMAHGTAINFAVQWAINRGFSTITLIEPDCLIYGNVWLTNLKAAIANGNWHAGSHVITDSRPWPWPNHIFRKLQPLHPCPSIWSLHRSANLSFEVVWKPDFVYSIHRFMDTALTAWYRMYKADKSQRVETPDFVHFWAGSYCQRRIGEQFYYTP